MLWPLTSGLIWGFNQGYFMNNVSPRSAARYLDGVTSQARDVSLSMTDQSLIISIDQETIAMWAYSKIFVKEDWINPTGAIIGYKDNLDASLTIHSQPQFQKIQQKLPRRHQASFIIPTQYRYLFLMAVGAVAAAFVLLPVIGHLAGLATYLIPSSLEKKFGQMMVDQMSNEFKPCDDKAAMASLQKISTRLAMQTGKKDIDPQIYLFKSSIQNAFSLPGEKIAVLSAFLNDAQSENEIAAVMAHEMGHMVKRDALEVFVESQGLGVITSLIGSSGSYGSVAQFASFMQTMNYSRKKEFQADEYGAILLVKAGYSPEGLSSFLSRMDKQGKTGLFGKASEYEEYIEFLSTHPDTKERVRRIGTYTQKSAASVTPSLTQGEFMALKNACRQ
jgi:predicted Zn-dependent protease